MLKTLPLLEKYGSWTNQNIDYDVICKDIKQLCNCKWVVFSLNVGGGKTTKILGHAGISNAVNTIRDLFGIEIEKREWEMDEMMAKIISTPNLTNHGELKHLPTNLLSKLFKRIISHVFNIGNVYSIGILKDKEVYGFISLVTNKGEELVNTDSLEIIRRFLGSLFYRIESEKNLINTRKKLQLIAEKSSDILTIIDRQNKVRYINKISPGFIMEEVLGDSVFNYVHPENHAIYAQCIEKSFNGIEITEEIKAVIADKKYGYYKVTFCPIELNDELQISITCTDITPIKKVITELQDSEENLLRTSSVARVGHWYLNLDTMEYTVSKTLHKVFDIDLSIFDASKMLDYLHEDSRDLVKKSHANLLSTGMPYEIIIRYEAVNDGQDIWVKSIGEAEKKDGKIIGIKGVMLNITNHYELLGEQKQLSTDLKELDERTTQIFNTIEDIIWSVDPTSSPVYHSNDNGSKFLGYTAEDFENDRELWRKFRHPDDMHLQPEEEKELFEKCYLEREQRLISKRGETVHVLNRVWLKRNSENSEQYTMSGIISNLTKHKQQEQQLIVLNYQTNQIFETIDDIVWADNLQTHERLFHSDDGTKFLGYTKDDFNKDPLLWKKYRHPDELSQIRNDMEQLHENKYLERESKLISKKGEVLDVFVRLWLRESIEKPGTNVLFGIYSNISEKKRAAEILEKEQIRLKNVIEATNIGTWEWNIETNEIVIDDRWANMLGYATDELTPLNFKSWINLIEPDDLKRGEEIMHKCFNKEIDYYECEYRMKHKNGQMKWIKGIGRIFKWSPDGKPELMYGTTEDISAEKERNQILLNTLDDLYETQKIAQIGRWEIDMSNGKAMISESLYSVLGLDLSKINLTYFSLLRITHPDDVEMVIKNFKQAVNKQMPFESVHRIFMNDNRIIWIALKGTFEYDKNGVALRILGTAQDVTPTKSAEEAIKIQAEQQRLFGLISASLISVTLSNYYDKINASLKTISTFFNGDRCYLYKQTSDGTEFLNTNKWCGSNEIESGTECPPSIPAAMLSWMLKKITADGHFKMVTLNEVPDDEVDLLNEFKRQKIHSILVAPIKDGSETMIGFIGIVSLKREINWNTGDIKLFEVLANVISDAEIKKELEEKNLKAKNVAISANKSKSEFLANMSHEIRTPLNAIIGFSELLKNKIQDSQLKLYLDGIVLGGSNLLAIINDILDLSKIEANHLIIEEQAVSIPSLFDELKSLFIVSASEKNIQFSLNYLTPEIEHIVSDEIRLRQILFNLIGNAIKFTNKSGAVNVDGECIKTTEGNYTLLLKVSDSGIGIAETEFKNIFEAFKQQDGQSSRKYGGTGLGLTITSRLVNLMNGEISLQSEVSKGSQFSVTFHSVKLPSENDILKLEAETSDNYEYYFENQKILIVEDNELNRNMLYQTLSQRNLDIKICNNGEEALAFIKTHSFDLVLLDIMMPEMDGHETLAKIREIDNYKHIPVLAVTAAGTSVDVSSFDGLIKKPIHQKKLFETITAQFYLKVKEKNIKNTTTHFKITAEQSKLIEQQLHQAKRTKSIDDVIHLSNTIFSLNIINEPLNQYFRDLKKHSEEFEIDEVQNMIENLEFEL
jgi:PAS domain S-box-containing protein